MPDHQSEILSQLIFALQQLPSANTSVYENGTEIADNVNYFKRLCASRSHCQIRTLGSTGDWSQ
jgi:hypothetical protein